MRLLEMAAWWRHASIEHVALALLNSKATSVSWHRLVCADVSLIEFPSPVFILFPQSVSTDIFYVL